MTSYMIAEKVDHKKVTRKIPTGLCCIILSSNSIKEQNINVKTLIIYKRHTTIGQILSNYKHLAFSKTKTSRKLV